ncbi:TolC family protein [Leptospira sp. GIMC2001]|uniref:TolC family protein n=1 Tax=Leptospira sp. GIMC2001 TaxID=1513297 RepID=UPI002349E2A0|nr:TolC family protein [Leptospira sp. GIMC2001]WCL51178.1 TolC family protein [Leptospira sp. GIMC2001]
MMIVRFLLTSIIILSLTTCSSGQKNDSSQGDDALTESADGQEDSKSQATISKSSDDNLDRTKNQSNPNSADGVSLTLDEAIRRALDNDPKVLRKKLELSKADTDELKNQGKYSWRVVADASIDQKKNPFNQSTIFTGTKTQTNEYNTGIEKLFSTGTYFKVNVGSTRFDSNAFEDQFRNPPGFSGLGIGPLYTGSVTATIAQDLLKNGFGYKERKTEQILENNSLIRKEELEQELSNIIVESLVDYWDYSVKENSVVTFEQLLNNTKNVRNLTIRKQGLGLSENFEVNQWNALLAQAESQLANAKVDRDEAKRKLLRTLNLPADTNFSKVTPLVEDLPKTIDYKRDLEYAYNHRADFRNMARKKENAELAMKMANNDALPTLKVSGSYGYQAQNLVSPQENFTSKNQGVSSEKYPIQQGAIDFSYPLFDKGVKAGIRDAEIQKRQANIEEDDLVRVVADDVKTKIDVLKATYTIYKNAENTEQESRKYYNGVLRSFQQGRFNAVSVKNALDSLVQDQLSMIRAKVDYNINLHRYYVSKNSLFEEYKIDKDKLVPSNNL